MPCVSSHAENSGAGLILDILELFVDTGHEKLFSRDIVALLRKDGMTSQTLKESSITEYHISKMLRSYGIRPSNIRIGKEVHRGYQAGDFRDALKRYVSLADKEARMEAAQHRWQLQDEARAEMAKQQALFEKFKAAIPRGKILSESEVRELALKLKREQEVAEPPEQAGATL